MTIPSNTFFAIGNELFIRPDIVADLMGVTQASLSSFENYRTDCPLKKEKDPNDGRKRGYEAYSVAEMMSQVSSGKISSKVFEDFPGYVPQENPFLIDMKENPTEVSRNLYEDLYKSFSSSDNSVKAPEPVKDSVDVVTAVTRLRTGIKHIVANSEGKDKEQDRLVDLVNGNCFGWLDETKEECNKFCKVRGACAAARNERLREYARQAMREDENAVKFDELNDKMHKLEEMRKMYQT